MSVSFQSDLAWSTPTAIFVKGKNLSDLIGSIDLGEMLFLLLTGRTPGTAEGKMTNAVLVSLVEHGVTPSAIAARLTYLGAPESLQAAVASGLLGVGSHFVGSVEQVARILQEGMAKAGEQVPRGGASVEAECYRPVAEEIVTGFRARKTPIPGIGHPIHHPEDPRTERLFALAKDMELSGPHIALQCAIRTAANDAYGKHFPINVTGAIGAIVSDMGFPWQIARGFPVISRCVGLVAHIREEIEHPFARSLWENTERRTMRPG